MAKRNERALDAAVAKVVFGRKVKVVSVLMGWSLDKGTLDRKHVAKALVDVTDIASGICHGYRPDVGHTTLEVVEVPYYHTWDDVAKVLNALKREKLNLELTVFQTGKDGWTHTARIMRRTSDHFDCVAAEEGEDMPTAVCLAALAAWSRLKLKSVDT